MGASRSVMPRTRLILRRVTTGGLRCKTPGPPPRNKGPGQMVPMALEQQAALPGGTRGIQPRQRLVPVTEHPVLLVNHQPTFTVHKHRTHWAEGHIGAGAQRQPAGGRHDPAIALTWQSRLQVIAQRERVQLTIKLPCHPDWLPCIKAMQKVDQPLLLTGLSNPVQLLWANSLDVAYVAPYVGRLIADGRDVWPLMRACVAVQLNGPALLAASIKSPDILSRLIACGAAAVTLPPESLVAWVGDALTQTAMAKFEQDIAASQAYAGESDIN